jgi:demethylspheroidene O-methyltransferase
MSSVADKSITTKTPLALTPEYGLWDRILIFRDQLIATKRFQRLAASLPIFRSISRSRASNLFDVMSGFVYSQILLACVRLNVFNLLKNGPLSLEELSRLTHFPMKGLQTLADAAVAIRLLERRSEARYGLGALGSPLVGNDAIAAMVEHHTAFYADMRDPLALLSGSMGERNLGKYWPYVSDKDEDQASLKNQESVAEYSALMSASLPLVADEIVDAYNFSKHQCMLDVGGGQGTFLKHVHEGSPQLKKMLFDLPGVAQLAAQQLASNPATREIQTHGGNFFTDTLPTGADLITLVRVIFDHDDERVLTLLASIYAALPSGGALLIAEPMADAPDAQAMGHAYFGFYLLAMGRGRPRTVNEISSLLKKVGFKSVQTVATKMPINTQIVLASR